MEAVLSPCAGGAPLYFLVDPAALIVPSLMGEGRSSLATGLIWEQGHSYSPMASLAEK